ncbi:uncharacterized protein LOC124453896 [Xenia sp. Carnegie-2017]|uniref:uncharacterized protein LOC124453896 n=1 Tax=Xenia sp. Carnegie-2017 TaxID=2897299 RepID=UPI001F04ACF7|nr:uncharacterized protein LOC124453896 [Xenia sp. Carnegie-2017]
MCLRECEDELQDLKFEFRDLQDEHEELKTSLDNTDGNPATTIVDVDKTSEIEILRAKIDALESDVERYRRAIGELQKTNKSFQERELELLNADREKTMHLDIAVKKIRALEKDLGMFARQSSELKAEIRALKNRHHESTFDLRHGEPASSRDFFTSHKVGDNLRMRL